MRIYIYTYIFLDVEMRFPDGIWVVAIYFAYLGIKKKKKLFKQNIEEIF